jgi:hypothetical protein
VTQTKQRTCLMHMCESLFKQLYYWILDCRIKVHFELLLAILNWFIAPHTQTAPSLLLLIWAGALSESNSADTLNSSASFFACLNAFSNSSSFHQFARHFLNKSIQVFASFSCSTATLMSNSSSSNLFSSCIKPNRNIV